MSDKSHVELRYSSILNVPFDKYDDFIFIVNEKKYQTTRIVADLLSPLICQYHSIDPTINEYRIKTTKQGDFSQILQLVKFKEQEIDDNDIEFIIEIVEKLENESIIISLSETTQDSEMTEDNIFTLIKHHLKLPKFYSKNISDEIDFISSHFFEIIKNHQNDLNDFSIDLIERILNNSQLLLEEEDQLLDLLNELYSNDSKYSVLYEYVLFKNVSVKKIEEFLNIFDINNITINIWKSIANRLTQEIMYTGKNDDDISKKEDTLKL